MSAYFDPKTKTLTVPYWEPKKTELDILEENFRRGVIDEKTYDDEVDAFIAAQNRKDR